MLAGRRYEFSERNHYEEPGNPGWNAGFPRYARSFQTLLDYLEGGQTMADFLDDFPTVTREAAVAALEHAKSLLVSELG